MTSGLWHVALHLVNGGISHVREMVSATQLARRRRASAAAIQNELIQRGYIEVRFGLHYFTEQGRTVGGEYRKNDPGASDVCGPMVSPAYLPLASYTATRGL